MKLTKNENGETFLSVYFDDSLKISDWKEGLKLLRATFPKITDDWVDVLTAKIKEKKFTRQQFKDAVDHVISNCEYSQPQIANILKYNKQIRLFGYYEFLKETQYDTADYRKSFKAVNVNGKLFYAQRSQLENNKINLPEWKNETISDDINKRSETFIPLSSSFSFIDAYNEMLKTNGKGREIENT